MKSLPALLILGLGLLICNPSLLAQRSSSQPDSQLDRSTNEGSARRTVRSGVTGTSSATATNDVIARIREEGLKRSEVMQTLSYLTDVIGPRLTGSPNLKRANEWTRDRLAAWGLARARLESWGPFGRGWSLQRFSAQVIDPQCIPLIAYPNAWSPGTEGTLVAPVVYFDATS